MQFAGVQHQSRRPFGAWQQTAAIQVTAQNRMAQLLAVDAQLMGAPGFRDELHPRYWQ